MQIYQRIVVYPRFVTDLSDHRTDDVFVDIKNADLSLDRQQSQGESSQTTLSLTLNFIWRQKTWSKHDITITVDVKLP